MDDNRDVADSAAILLNTVGFKATACYSGAEALAVAPDFRPVVCLIDLNMPVMRGDVLAERLRCDLHYSPLILVAMTAMSDDDSRRRIRDAGFDLHLVKPVDVFNVISVVDRLWRSWTETMARLQSLAGAK